MLLALIVFNFWNAVYTHANIVAKGHWSVRGQTDVTQQQTEALIHMMGFNKCFKSVKFGGRQC